jgi:acyl-CoA dehydrogenase
MSEFVEPFARMLTSVSGCGIDPAAQWQAIEASGYLDALVPEERGGAGLALADIEPLIRALGRCAIAAPVAETMAKRALDTETLERPLAAVLAAAEIAGLAEKMLEMSLSYANDRVQFGKPIGKLQVIQQQLAVMGEQVLMARMASQIGCSQGLKPTTEVAAAAKQVASAAVPQIAAIAHAVHGAIGITEEFDLQRYSRRLHALRLEHGSESYWAGILGKARLQADRQSSVDFIRALRQP